MFKWIFSLVSKWLEYEAPVSKLPLSNYHKLSSEVRIGDVILLEGRTRVSNVIRVITQSPWTHAAIYIGRYYQIQNSSLKSKIKELYGEHDEAQYLIESNLSQGTVIVPLESYCMDHLRICRPSNISDNDIQVVIQYAFDRLGTEYNVRQIFDLARLLFPWGIMPRKWRSSLFEHNVGEPTKTVCSSMLARAFQSVKYPILPLLALDDTSGLKLYVRNPQLFTPSDFDYSPYFEIIKYPFIDIETDSHYRALPWSVEDISHNDEIENLLSAEQIMAFTADEDRFNGYVTLKEQLEKLKEKQSYESDFSSNEAR